MFSVGWRYGRNPVPTESQPTPAPLTPPTQYFDPYSPHRSFAFGFPVGFSEVVITKADERFDAKLKYTVRYSVPDKVWPVHCYGMVGVGRNLSPDTGSGAELYAVIGHAPRHLDRNIALVGRVIEGMEHLSSLPRGTGSLGFYESAKERVPIRSVRIGTAAKDLPAFEYLNSDSESFARYAEARANRRDPFFVQPAGGADICNIPVPVRRVL
jgi:peptidylprolyl isomerase